METKNTWTHKHLARHLGIFGRQIASVSIILIWDESNQLLGSYGRPSNSGPRCLLCEQLVSDEP